MWSKVAQDNFSILLYADDIVLLSESEEDLQKMLTCLHKWCQKCSLNINILKSSVIHFRPIKVPLSCANFTCGTNILDIVHSYKYLGVILDEHLTFLPCIESRTLAGSRAFSSIINKYNMYMNFTYDIYLQLYNTSVVPTLLYGAEIWGYLKFKSIVDIQKSAL